MLTDYHVHIERGPYTFDWLDQFMETAQKQHIEEIGIVEHSHRFEEMAFMYADAIQDETPLGQYQKNWLNGRLKQTTLPAYIEFLSEAKKRGYPVKMGLEICYFPQYEAETKQILNLLKPDFIIGSVHWLGGWAFDHPATKAEWATHEQLEVKERYNQLLSKAIRSGMFNIVGHIDSIKAFSPWPLHDWLNHELLQEIKQSGICVEVNTGVKYRVNCPEYCPTEEFLTSCFDYGIDITLASDAHFPGDVGKLFDESIALVKKVGYRETVRFNQQQKYKIQI